MITPAEFEKGLTLTGVGLSTAFVALGLLFLIILLIYWGLRLFNHVTRPRLQRDGPRTLEGPTVDGSAAGSGNGGEAAIAVAADDPDREPHKIKEMVAAVAAAVAMGRGGARKPTPRPGPELPAESGASAPGERWRSFGRQEIMQGRQLRRGWRR